MNALPKKDQLLQLNKMHQDRNNKWMMCIQY
jgi:hypothetical protein